MNKRPYFQNATPTCLITGASSGIGFELTKVFYQKGYNLVLVGKNEEKLRNVKNIFKNTDTFITTIAADLSENGSSKALFEQCENKNIEINILVNNAGVGIFGEHVTISPNKIEEMLGLNIINLTLLCTFFGSKMKKSRSGYILNVASTAAYQPVPKLSAYAASKSYVLNFSEALSKEMEEYGVTVSCLSPGHTATNFFNRAGIGDESKGFFSVKSRMTAEEVAKFGVDILFAKKISAIPGFKNKFLTFTNRIAPRAVVANISKKLLSST